MSDTETLIEHLREWKDIYKGQPVSIALRRAYTALADMQTLLGVRDRELAEAREQCNVMRLQLIANGSDSPVGACNCVTKSPTIHHHARGCKYRLIMERDEVKMERDRLAETLADTEQCFDQSQRSLGQMIEQRDRLAEALGDLHSAAKGLAHGTDWNHGTHAIMHGYRARLLAAIPAAAEALSTGVHSCSTYCKRPLCVARRERDEYKAQRDMLARALNAALNDWELFDSIAHETHHQAEEALAAVEGGQDAMGS